MTGRVGVGLSAVVAAMRGGELATLTVRAGGVAALPSGAFDPSGRPTFELALRDFVAAQTGFELGYVEQLYTFGDRGRDVPSADAEAEAHGARMISIGYLGLTPQAPDTRAGAWTPWTRFFPWEDWRRGRPAAHIALEPPLRAWASRAPGRAARAGALFALDGLRWNEERVLERYELLYEAGLATEARRDRHGEAGAPGLDPAVGGEAMASDHRRILATGLGRLRGKLKYRPVVFELMGPSFTLSELQRTVEAISGVALHKPNFRRMLERTQLVEELGEMDSATGGRPARRFRFRRAEAALAPAVGFSLPLLREG